MRRACFWNSAPLDASSCEPPALPFLPGIEVQASAAPSNRHVHHSPRARNACVATSERSPSEKKGCELLGPAWDLTLTWVKAVHASALGGQHASV
eukprot:365968-Chlamydomonas_euryale.AAC.3